MARMGAAVSFFAEFKRVDHEGSSFCKQLASDANLATLSEYLDLKIFVVERQIDFEYRAGSH